MKNEYIRKQDAVNVVANTAKIVASFNYQYAIDALSALAPADVVPVVRCRDCKYVRKWRSEESAKKFGQVYECACGVLACPNPNDFCSYGERKSES